MLERREAVGFVGAILAHATVFPLLSVVPLRSPASEILGDQESVSLELESSIPELLPSPTPTTPSPVRLAERIVKEIRNRATTPANLPLSPSSVDDADDRLDPGAVAWVGGTPPPMPVNRVGARDGSSPNSAGTTREGLDPAREASNRIDRLVHDALVAHDHALGLDDAGALVTMAEDCVRASETPLDGKAYFDVTINADGTVASAQVIAGSEPATGTWQAVASRLVEMGRSRSVLWRRTGKPLRVRLEASSRWVLPSGSRPGHPLTRTGKLGETWETAGEDVLPSKFPLAPSAVAAGARFDVTDIGARALRDVHARILKETSP